MKGCAVSKPPEMPDLGTPAEVADHLRLPVAQLAQFRYAGSGPKFVKIGRRIRYRWCDESDWSNHNKMEGTDDAHG